MNEKTASAGTVPPPEEMREQHQQQQQRPVNAYAAATWWSKLFFTWPYPLLKKGTTQTLTDDDLYAGLESDSSSHALANFNRIWQAEKRRNPTKPSLRRALARDFFVSVWYVQPLLAIGAFAKVAQAIFLKMLIDYFEGKNDRGYLWAGILVLCGAAILFEHHHLFFITWRKGMQIRVAGIAAIYDKCFRLSSIRQSSSVSYGKVMNLASNDVERFLMAALFVNYLIWAPIQCVAILIVGYWLLGLAFVAGFCLLILVFIPLQIYLGGMFAHYRSKIAAVTDNRVTFVSQAVRGARVMKMSGYENRFLERIMQYRKQEVFKIAQANTLKSWNEALFFSSNVVISLVIFLVHVHTGNTLQQGDVFAVFTLINILQLEMTKHMSIAVMATSEVYVSIGRIQEFLDYPEVEESGNGILAPTTKNQGEILMENNNAIELLDVCCYWKKRQSESPDVNSETDSVSETGSTGTPRAPVPALLDVSVRFQKGELTAVIGDVGSSKSALLQAIVRELPLTSGHIFQEYKSLAYAPQDAWIMDGTVKENILMGLDWNEVWYNQVVDACALALDFRQLSHGDETILGDRGVQCSGGQRARIGLARAIYRDTDVLVVDDPLSAVDSKVGRQLFQEALLGLGVRRGKCVILATHQHQYVSDCRCVMMVDGHVECIGSYDECVASSKGKLTAHAANDTVVSLTEGDTDVKSNELTSGALIDDLKGNETTKLLDNGKADHKETNSEGKVEWDTYLNYLRAMGGVWIGVCLFLLFSVTQGSVLFTITTVGRWAEREAEEQNNWDITGLVMGLGGLVVLLSLVRVFICFHLTNKAAQRLHDKMAQAVLRAKIQFYDTNPLGRILNRFSADTGILDDQLPPTLFDFYMLAFVVFGAVVTTVVTLPFVLVALPFLCWYFVTVRGVFISSSRELKRLEGLARSPIFAMLSEALGGIATIRSNNATDFFKKKFQMAHDTHTRCFFVFIAASRWVGFRMDSLVFLFLSIVSFLSVLFHREGWFDVDPAILGLSLSMLLQLAGLFQWCIRQSAEVVNQMVSVERVLAFGKLPSEAPLELDVDKNIINTGWPSEGAIAMEDVSVRYRTSLPLALDSISFSIPPGSRVGIVGRSGSGKSTLMQALFRLLESEHGQIVIDGVNIAQLGLHALRTNISVIPQTPTLFSGCSLRENLDLFGLHSDESLRKVIDDCHLSQMVEDLPEGLDSIVSNGSFSTGQRQLLCLARALLRKNKILILDEATANVDRRTDYLLQETLHESFRDGTILAIAHRLITIIEYDFCVVLGGGKLLEFGTPASLIRSGGSFAAMVADTGEVMSSELKQRAFQKEKRTEE